MNLWRLSMRVRNRVDSDQRLQMDFRYHYLRALLHLDTGPDLIDKIRSTVTQRFAAHLISTPKSSS